MIASLVTLLVFQSDQRKIVFIHDQLGKELPVFPPSDVAIPWQNNKSSIFVQFLVEITTVVQWQNVAEI